MTKSKSFSLIALAVAAASCNAPPAPATAAAAAPDRPAQMNMLQFMRAFPFPHSNVLFDTQGTDPEGEASKESMSFSVYRWMDADTYAGWAGVENSALALAEMAPLLLTPRLCANGRPAPIDHPRWKAAVDGMVAAGQAAHKAARAKNTEAMLEVGETVSNACAACHDPFRDVDLEGGERCSIPADQ